MPAERKATYQYPIDVDIAMNDHLTRLIHTRGEAASEYERVKAPLEFHEHQASKWCLRRECTSLFLLLHGHLRAFSAAAVLVSEILLLCLLPCIRLVRSHVGQSTREEPAFEHFLRYMVAVIPANETLAAPPLLEESHRRAREVHFLRDGAQRTSPQNIEIERSP